MSKGKKSSYKDQLKGRTEQNHKEKDSGGRGSSVINSSKLPEGAFFKVKEGKQTIDIIPYIVTTDKHPKLSKGNIDYLLDVWVHRSVGAGEDSFICLKKNYKKACPICEEMEQLIADGQDDDVVNALKPKRRVFYNIKDAGSDKDEIQIFEQSHFKFEKELLEEAESDDGEVIVFSDPTDGMSVEIKGKKASFKGRDFIEVRKISLVDRDEQYDDDIIEEAYSLDALLIVPTYEQMRDSFHGLASDTEENEENEEKPVKKKSAKKEEPEDDEEDDDEEDAPKNKKDKAEDKKGKGGKCPHGHAFGAECDEHKDCKKCESWDECSDAYDADK